MLHITNHQGYANKNHNVRMATIKKTKVTNIGKGMEKWKPLYTIKRIIKWCNHYENIMKGVPAVVQWDRQLRGSTGMQI